MTRAYPALHSMLWPPLSPIYSISSCGPGTGTLFLVYIPRAARYCPGNAGQIGGAHAYTSLSCKPTTPL